MPDQDNAAAHTSPTTRHDDADADDNGVNLTTVLVALGLLAVLVVGLYWVLPAWFGSSVINVTVRQ
jgi:hypothetical protein